MYRSFAENAILRASRRFDSLSPTLSLARHCTTSLVWLVRHRNGCTGFVARSAEGDEHGAGERDGTNRAVIGIQACKVNVPYFFVSLATMVQFGSIGSVAV